MLLAHHSCTFPHGSKNFCGKLFLSAAVLLLLLPLHAAKASKDERAPRAGCAVPLAVRRQLADSFIGIPFLLHPAHPAAVLCIYKDTRAFLPASASARSLTCFVSISEIIQSERSALWQLRSLPGRTHTYRQTHTRTHLQSLYKTINPSGESGLSTLRKVRKCLQI